LKEQITWVAVVGCSTVDCTSFAGTVHCLVGNTDQRVVAGWSKGVQILGCTTACTAAAGRITADQHTRPRIEAVGC